MFSPISRLGLSASLCLLLAACGSGNTDADLKAAEEQQAQDAVAEGKIECALAGSTEFNRNCTTERVSGPEGQLLVVRHADGGFRRFKILTDGRGLAPADGIDPDFKITVLAGGMIEVRSVDDVYRLPAAIKGGTPK
ncbi:MAG: hypothetical protein RL481_209 [Pseudomonadota bacterium]|jgi:hypothetical protein